MKDKLIRVDIGFSNKIEEIREDEAVDSKKVSSRLITYWIAKHNSWPRIKKDIIKKLGEKFNEN